MYKLFYEKRVFKDLDKIPNKDLGKIIIVFNRLAENPRPHGSKKLSAKQDLYRVRQGDYRIVYMINDQDKKISIILVRHRKNVYRELP